VIGLKNFERLFYDLVLKKLDYSSVSDGFISPATVIFPMSFLNGSSPRRTPPPENTDIEAGPLSRRSSDVHDDGNSSDPFDIARTKHASIDRLRRWRACFLFFLTLMIFVVIVLLCSCLSLFVCLFLKCLLTGFTDFCC
jgi:hypothetical protein